MRVSVVATGIDADAAVAPRPHSLSLVSDRGEQSTATQPAPATASQGTPAAMTAAAEAVAEPDDAPPAVAGIEQPAAPAEPVMEADEAPTRRAAGNRLYAWSQAVAAGETALAEPSDEAEPQRAAPFPQAAFERGVEPGETRSDDAFIAPRPVEPEPEPAPVAAEADPFAAAALANGSRVSRQTGGDAAAFDRKKAQRLFARMTGGAARALSAAAQVGEQPEPPRAEPSLSDAGARGAEPVRVAAEGASATTAPRAAPSSAAQPRLAGLDTAEPGGATQPEEEFLDIPAFLRRQAN